jgi:hypothetical protein
VGFAADYGLSVADQFAQLAQALVNGVEGIVQVHVFTGLVCGEATGHE